MQRVRLALGIGFVAVLGGALLVVLVTNSAGQRGVAASPTPTAGSSVAAAAPSPLPSPVEVPTPDMTGRDFERIAREMIAFRDWLYENPEVGIDHIGLIYHRDCECFEEVRTNLQDLVDDGVRFDDEGSEVEVVTVVEDFGEVVRLHIVARRLPQRVVDDSGEVQEESTGAPPVELSVVMEEQPRGGWLVRSIDVRGRAA